MLPNELTVSFHSLLTALDVLEIRYEISGAVPSSSYSFKSLRQVEPMGIFFVSSQVNPRPDIADSVILSDTPDFGGKGNVTICVSDPQVAFYRLMRHLVMPRSAFTGVHPTAVIGPDCEIGANVTVGPFCVLERCVIGDGANIGSHVTVMPGSEIGRNTTIEAHSAIGATGVAWAWDQERRERVVQPQIGYVHIGPDCFLGTSVTVVRGSVNEVTWIGEGSVISHGSRIGHGCRIGAHAHFANNVTVAGNVTLGAKCFLAAGAVLQPQLRLAERTVVGIGSVVVKNFDEPGCLLAGMPARKIGPANKRLPGVPRHLQEEQESP